MNDVNKCHLIAVNSQLQCWCDNSHQSMFSPGVNIATAFVYSQQRSAFPWVQWEHSQPCTLLTGSGNAHSYQL